MYAFVLHLLGAEQKENGFSFEQVYFVIYHWHLAYYELEHQGVEKHSENC